MNPTANSNDPSALIIQVINEENPGSVQELVDRVNKKVDLPKKEIFALVVTLNANGQIKLSSNIEQAKKGLGLPFWYTLIISVGIIATILAFAVPLDAYPLIYFRNIFGVLFLFFLPGYALTRTLYPQRVSRPSPTSLERIELFILSIGLSIALVCLMALMLYYSPLKLNLGTATASLFAFSATCSTAAVLRERANFRL